MGKKVEMIGKRFGRWVVLERHSTNKNGTIRYLCKCDCGVVKDVSGVLLRNGQSSSCGCYNKEIISNPNRVRGTKLYGLYLAIKRRCCNPKCKEYKNYGGRGIRMCDEWSNGFFKFKEWALKNGYKSGLWIDRINNDGNYEPSNCRWATPKEQANNKRTNHLFTYNGETHTIKEWSEAKNINYGTLMQRINNHKDPFAPVDLSKSHNFKKLR